MLCARECPDWCIYIDSHKETLPPKREGGRPRKRNVLDRFAIDYALCMYCGICVEVCPYDALFWSREFEYAEYDIRELTHEKERLSDWMSTVLPPPPLEEGAEQPGRPGALPAASNGGGRGGCRAGSGCDPGRAARDPRDAGRRGHYSRVGSDHRARGCDVGRGRSSASGPVTNDRGRQVDRPGIGPNARPLPRPKRRAM